MKKIDFFPLSYFQRSFRCEINFSKVCMAKPTHLKKTLVTCWSGGRYIDEIAFHRKGLVINYGEGGGGLQNGKIAGLKFVAPPPPQDRVKLFAFKEWKLFAPPFNMAKSSSNHIKTTPKLVVPPPPPSAWLTLFLPPFSKG